ncbi:unnamed protein product [Discula destructiva]
MPRTALPPTPASSTDIHGKDGTKQLSSLHMAFELPEPAILNAAGGRARAAPSFSPVSPVSTTSPKAPYPIQPSEAVKSRRRSSVTAAAAAASTAKENSGCNSTHNTFALPPPPTRSRKIIQMKPRLVQDGKRAAEVEMPPAQALAPATGTSSGKATGKRTAAAASASEAGPSKKKQPSTTSAAGRKIARKTAHSLIERRRRSKMNEEFAVLKGMIPACTGEMHKLAILQASIEYVRYLQDCIEKLQSRDPQIPTEKDGMGSPFQPASYQADGDFQSQEQQQMYPNEEDEEEEDDEDEQHSPDVEMGNSEDVAPSPSPTSSTHPYVSTAFSHQTSISPALPAQDAAAMRQRHGSYASVNSTAPVDYHYHRPYSYSSSAVTSPVWGAAGPAGYVLPPPSSTSGSTLTSPALGPMRERDLDQEATAALLMLNSDRRGTVGQVPARGGGSGVAASGAGRGMSVRDLLSA